MNVLREIDLPPLWTLGAIALALGLERIAPLGLLPPSPTLGWAVIGLSLALMVWAAATMIAARTPVIPRREPATLVTAGPFRFSRNPIYLGDLGLVLGAGLVAGALWAAPVAALLAVTLERRWIRGEEAALAAAYPQAFAAWSARTRRWL